MTTWTREQVYQVRGLRAVFRPGLAFDLDREHTLPKMREQMARHLIDMAHTFAVEPHVVDFRLRQEEDRFITWWEPDVREIELYGGDQDGRIMAFGDSPWVPLRCPVEPQWTNDLVPTLNYVTYEMTGWREDERRWVYRPTEPR